MYPHLPQTWNHIVSIYAILDIAMSSPHLIHRIASINLKFLSCAQNVSVKKGMIGQHCIACGHSNQIDMRHKVTTFIIKNPPVEESSVATTPGKKGKKAKGASATQTNGDASPEVGNGDNNMTPVGTQAVIR